MNPARIEQENLEQILNHLISVINYFPNDTFNSKFSPKFDTFFEICMAKKSSSSIELTNIELIKTLDSKLNEKFFAQRQHLNC